MSTTKKSRVPNEYGLTAFGGVKIKRCLQINPNEDGYICLDMEQAEAMMQDLKDFLKDKLKDNLTLR